MSALRVVDFRRLWLAGLISEIGDWLLLVSLPIVVYEYTGSTFGTAAALLIELVPPVFLAPLAGRLADRLDRRRTLLLVALAQAVTLTPLLLVHGRAGLPIVYAVIAVQSALRALFEPTKNALLPTLVDRDRLVSANSMVGLNTNVGRLVGGPLGGLLLAAGGGLRAITLVDAASFLLAFALIARLAPAREVAPNAQAGAPLTGWRMVLRSRPIRAGLVVVLTASVAQGIFAALFVVFVARALHGGAAEIGLLRGVQGIGAIGCGLGLGLIRRVAPARMAAVAAIGFGGLSFAIWNAPAISTAQPLYVALFIVAGAPGVALLTGLVSALQEASVEGQRGKVFAAVGVAASVGEAMGLLAAGVLGDPLGIVTVLNAQAGLYVVAGLLAAFWLAAPTARAKRPACESPSIASGRKDQKTWNAWVSTG